MGEHIGCSKKDRFWHDPKVGCADEVSFRGRLFNVRFRKCSKMFIDARKEHLGTIGLSNEKLDQICFWETKGGKL
jgi:hypothetical protein